MIGWNGRYHVCGNTYGTWLRGDPRGWRARHHREHVEGDYKNPPPEGTYAKLYRRSHDLLGKDPVLLDVAAREAAGKAMVEMLLHAGAEPIALSVDRVHYHILARFPDGQVRRPVGRAKKHASFVLTALGVGGTAWGKRCKVKPIAHRKHQLHVFNYIRQHERNGAWAWTFREGLYWVAAGQSTMDFRRPRQSADQ